MIWKCASAKISCLLFYSAHTLTLTLFDPFLLCYVFFTRTETDWWINCSWMYGENYWHLKSYDIPLKSWRNFHLQQNSFAIVIKSTGKGIKVVRILLRLYLFCQQIRFCLHWICIVALWILLQNERIHTHTNTSKWAPRIVVYRLRILYGTIQKNNSLKK